MSSRLESYANKKGLIVNPEKTKIMRFKRGVGRKKIINWRWKGKKLEEVKQFKYLGYTFQRSGGQEAHIKEKTEGEAR